MLLKHLPGVTRLTPVSPGAVLQDVTPSHDGDGEPGGQHQSGLRQGQGVAGVQSLQA